MGNQPTKGECDKQLADLDRRILNTSEEYVTVTLLEGKNHDNAHHRLELLCQQRQNLLEQCKEVTQR
jgi:hypothetical protein